MKKIVLILSLTLLLIGLTGFVSGFLISLRVVDYHKELPLGQINSFVVDHTGNIYIGLDSYGKIQVYNEAGEFLYNWNVESNGGLFNIDLTKEQNIIVSTARGDKQILYDKQGNIISNKTIKDIYNINKFDLCFTTQDSSRYCVEDKLFPSIKQTFPDQKTIISQGFLLDVMKCPSPAWEIGVFGMFGIVIFILLKKKRFNNN
jgi:hypothetical protein